MPEEDKHICKICGEKDINRIWTHINFVHKGSIKTYYDMFFKQEGEGICEFCGKETAFMTFNIGYQLTCGDRKCNNLKVKQVLEKKYKDEEYKKKVISKTKSTKKEKYGNENYVNVEKVKKTKLEKYGDENYNNIEKGRKTKLARYGDENYRNMEMFSNTWKKHTEKEKESRRIKTKKTKLERYGDENYHNIEKTKQTYLIKYGDENYRNIEKTKQTKLEKYGDENYCNAKQIVKTKKERYGDKYELIVDKIKKTNLEKYGVSSTFFKSRDFYSKISQELFWSIYNQLPKELQGHTYFAELNKEFHKYDEIQKKSYFYDFVINNKKICIEFNGDIYHANPQLFSETDCPNPYNKLLTAKEIWEFDNQKNNILLNNNFIVMIVWEKEYRKNKQKTIETCLKYINTFGENNGD